MKRRLLATASILIALLLPGCLQSETTIHLHKDGSGTVVEQNTIGPRMLAMLQEMAGLGGAAAQDPVAEMFPVEKAKAKAATMGDGVTFEKSEPLDLKGNKGVRTTYRFADINKLRIATGDALTNMSPKGDQVRAASKQEPVSFALAGGTLTMTLPDPEKNAAAAARPPATPEEDLQMEEFMKEMLGDMKVSMKLVIEPGIAETDATYRDADTNTITLVDMEMGKLIGKPDSLKKLNSIPKDNPAAAMELLKDLEGVKVETKKLVTVKLK